MAADQGREARAQPATESLLSGYMGADTPRVPSPRCKLCLACKFGSCQASFIFIACGFYTLTSAAALSTEFPVTGTLERVQYGDRAQPMRRDPGECRQFRELGAQAGFPGLVA